MEAIAWAAGLPHFVKTLAPEDWQALADFLSSLPAEVDQQTLKDQPLLHQLLAGELAWTLATRLTQTSVSRRLQRSGRAAICLALGQILNRQGMLRAGHFHSLRPLLACWTRCRGLAAGLPLRGWGPRAEKRYQQFVRNALRCTRPDGRALLDEDDLESSEWESQARAPCTRGRPDVREGDSWGRELFEAVLQSGVDESDRSIAAIALPKMSAGAAKAPKKAADLPAASIHFEEGAIAVMRRNWNRNDERVAVLFAGQACELELVASGQVATSGAWRFVVTQQGQQLLPVTDWESTCWYTDEDVDYLELEIELTAGVKLQRQIVLAREDRFLLLADALMSPQGAGLEYRSLLPSPPQVEFRGAEESREGLFVQSRVATTAVRGVVSQSASRPATYSSRSAVMPLAKVMPLGLPEWRAQQNPGELKAIAGGLELRQSAAGQRLYAPLFIDLDRSRFRRRMTWRQLTVAESLTPVPSDTAVGFRIAIGPQQWIIYRALASRSNRTLLGHNLATESLIARFGKDGEVTSIVEIE